MSEQSVNISSFLGDDGDPVVAIVFDAGDGRGCEISVSPETATNLANSILAAVKAVDDEALAAKRESMN